MAILHAFGEDLDWPNGSAVSVSTLAGSFRSAYARCSILPAASTTTIKSTPCPGGEVTSCWVSFYAASIVLTTSSHLVGICKSGTEKGIFLGGASSTKLALFKWDGSSLTQLATESGAMGSSQTGRFDIQIVNFGASATINVYFQGTLLINFTGDASISGITGLDSIYLRRSGSTQMNISECIIASEDTRLMNLQTLVSTGAGTTQDWTAAGTINGTTISDTTPAYTNTAAKNEQYNVTNLASGVWTIKAISTSIRAAKSADATPTKIRMGWNNGGSVASGAGGDSVLTTAYATYQSLDTVDPTTSAVWDPADIDALQLNLASVA